MTSPPALLVLLALIFAALSLVPWGHNHVLLGVAVVLLCVRLLIGG